MTRKQYERMATDFSQFAGMTVPYRVRNLYKDNPGHRSYGEKYLNYFGQLWGVGIGSMTESFIIANGGHTYAIHFKDITWPL